VIPSAVVSLWLGVVYNRQPVVETQFLNGGLRLAHILNLIFDDDYRAANPSPVIDEALRGRK
ncbi:MAG: S1/P1 nuclease, partial [Duncaniella sp.]|nr:S1/P1 nuclease [Duncaniella sp.]